MPKPYCDDLRERLVVLVMAWSPVRRFKVGRFEVDRTGDYATLNSYQPRDATLWNIAYVLTIVVAFGSTLFALWTGREDAPAG